jgi:hypothetical protein
MSGCYRQYPACSLNSFVYLGRFFISFSIIFDSVFRGSLHSDGHVMRKLEMDDVRWADYVYELGVD